MKINPILNVDSYKTSHFGFMENGTTEIFSYIENRVGGSYKSTVFFGLQFFLKEYLSTRITMEMVDEAETFIMAHGEPFNRSGWEYIVKHLNGKIPLRIKAVPEGTVVPEGNVLVTVENTDPNCAWVSSYFETALLRAVWYPSTVATRSKKLKEIITNYLYVTGSPSLIDFKLIDFGARGVSSLESSMISGAAHLVNFLGTDNIAGIHCVQKYYNTTEMVGFSIPACYDKDTEILTSQGFKPFKELSMDDKVAEYHTDNTIFFNTPEKIIESYYEGNMVHFSDQSNGKVDLMVTPNHRMIRKSLASDKIEIFLAADAGYSHRNRIIQNGRTHSGKSMSPMDRLKVAFQADGAFASHAEDYNGSRNDTSPIRFSFKKRRKIDRLTSILDELNIFYTKNTYENGYTHFWVAVPVVEKFQKDLSWIDISNISYEWANDFIEECSYWDGHRRNNNLFEYTSINKNNTDTVQAIAVLCGVRTLYYIYKDKRENRKTTYKLSLWLNNEGILGTKVKKTIVPYKGNIYCVTVKSGMIVTRRNNKVAISGNSEHSVTTSWGVDREEEFFSHAIDTYGGPGKMISLVADSYDLFNAINILGTKLKQKIIDNGCTIVVRPDSGDPVEMVLRTVESLANHFGFQYNTKGYKVLHPSVRVIQGDGINENSVDEILRTLALNKYSADNVTFGCGGYLLQQLNRDTQRFAMKASSVVVNGERRDICKTPKTDLTKASKKGRITLVSNVKGISTKNEEDVTRSDIVLLKTVFENGEIINECAFDEVRKNAGHAISL